MSSPESRDSASSSSATGSSAFTAEGLSHSVCAFWIGKRCYALDTSFVGEVVTVEAITPVPLSPPGLLGLFNLRGTPVALVDVAEVLALPDAAPSHASTRTALVLKTAGMLAGALIDRMEGVIPVGRGRYTPRGAGGGDHPLAQGFLEVSVRGGTVLTVLDSSALIQRLKALKFR